MPMKIGEEPLFDRIDKGIHDGFTRQAIASAQDRLRGRKLDATENDDSLGDWELWRKAGEEIRNHTLENLDYYLEQLSDNFSARGGHVFFAKDAEEACKYIQGVVKEKNAKKVVKAKSMVTEEISLNEALEEIGCEVLESDLAEFILQVDDHDRPSHIVVPSLHKNKEQIRDTFRNKLGYTGTEKPEELAAFARAELRDAFLNAEVGITGCNFAVADSGTITLVTNEGNANMVTTLPETQITVMGMERIVPSWEDLDILITLLCRSAVGQRITTYVTGITPELEEDCVDSPKDYHLVIIDNGRSKALGDEFFQPALDCIRCGACVNVCPAYRHVGGHAYGSIYPGPIGALISPILGGYEEYGELPFLCSLCGACTEACPVEIPIHELLIKHRQNYVYNEGKAKFSEKVMMKGFGVGASSPTLFKMAEKLAPTLMKPLVKDDEIQKGPGPMKPWTDVRNFPAPSNENFRNWFREHKKSKTEQ